MQNIRKSSRGISKITSSKNWVRKDTFRSFEVWKSTKMENLDRTSRLGNLTETKYLTDYFTKVLINSAK